MAVKKGKTKRAKAKKTSRYQCGGVRMVVAVDECAVVLPGHPSSAAARR